MSDFFSSHDVTTRKEHTCDGCYAKIPKGSRVTYNVGKFRGDFFASYICQECDDFMWKHREYFEEGWSLGDVGRARRDEERETSDNT